MPTSNPTAAVPQATPAWWAHWLNLALQAALFIGVAIHPGWQPPPVLPIIVTIAAPLLAATSAVVLAISDHHLSKFNVENLVYAARAALKQAAALQAPTSPQTAVPAPTPAPAPVAVVAPVQGAVQAPVATPAAPSGLSLP